MEAEPSGRSSWGELLSAASEVEPEQSFEAARARLELELKAARQKGQTLRECLLTNGLALVAYREGDHPRAEEAQARAEELWEQMQPNPTEARVLYYLESFADLLRQVGLTPEAQALRTRVEKLTSGSGDPTDSVLVDPWRHRARKPHGSRRKDSWAELLSRASGPASEEPPEAAPPPANRPSSSWAGLLEAARDEQAQLLKLETRLDEELRKAREQEDRLGVCVAANCLAVVVRLKGRHLQAVDLYHEAAETWKALDPSCDEAAARFEAVAPMFGEQGMEDVARALLGCAENLRFGPRSAIPLLDPWTDLAARAPEARLEEPTGSSELWRALKRFRWRYWVLPGWLIPYLVVALTLLGLAAAAGWYGRQAYLRHYYDTYRAAQQDLFDHPGRALEVMSGLLAENPAVAEPHLYRAAARLLDPGEDPQALGLARQEAWLALEKDPKSPEGHYYLAVTAFSEGATQVGFDELQKCQQLLGTAYAGDPERTQAWMQRAEELRQAVSEGGGRRLAEELVAPHPSMVPPAARLKTRLLPFWHYLGHAP